MTKFRRYETAPSERTFFFLSKNHEDHFANAEPAVQKAAMNLLEACVKKSMHELCMDHIAKELESLRNEIEELKKSKKS